MNAVNDILNRIPMDQLADELGTDQATAEQAARQAVASLVGGMQYNAANPVGETSLAGALNEHSSSRFFTESRVDLNEVDTDEGEKIVTHVFGTSHAQPAALGGLLGNDQVQKLLKMLAPIVIGYLAGKVTGGGFGDVLGDILGGGSRRGPQAQPKAEPEERSGGSLGDILGQILGGGGGATPPESMPQHRADNPFNPPTPGQPSQKFPTSTDAPEAQPRQEEAKRKDEGGGLGDILGDIFGKR